MRRLSVVGSRAYTGSGSGLGSCDEKRPQIGPGLLWGWIPVHAGEPLFNGLTPPPAAPESSRPAQGLQNAVERGMLRNGLLGGPASGHPISSVPRPDRPPPSTPYPINARRNPADWLSGSSRRMEWASVTPRRERLRPLHASRRASAERLAPGTRQQIHPESVRASPPRCAGVPAHIGRSGHRGAPGAT